MVLKIMAKLSVFGLALILSAAPTMACLWPTVTLTAAERACCKHMANQCGHAGMPSSHSCCQGLNGPETTTFVRVAGVQLEHVANIEYHVSPTIPVLVIRVPPSQTNFELETHGPPGLPSSSSTT